MGDVTPEIEKESLLFLAQLLLQANENADPAQHDILRNIEQQTEILLGRPGQK
jgi:hypothetical protein